MARAKAFVGIIIPQKWDEKGNIISIAISTAGEKEYTIEMNGMGKNLMKRINHRIQLEGTLNPYTNSLTVDLYKVIDWQ